MARCSRIGYPAPIGPSPSAVRHISVTSSLGSSDRVIAQGRSENAHRSHRETRLKVRVLSCAGPCSQLLYTSLFTHIHRYTCSNYHRTDDRLCWRGHTIQRPGSHTVVTGRARPVLRGSETRITLRRSTNARHMCAHQSSHTVSSQQSRPAPHSGFRTCGRARERIVNRICLLYTSPSPRDRQKSRMPSSA